MAFCKHYVSKVTVKVLIPCIMHIELHKYCMLLLTTGYGARNPETGVEGWRANPRVRR